MKLTQYNWYFYKKIIIKNNIKNSLTILPLSIIIWIVSSAFYSQELREKTVKNKIEISKDTVPIKRTDSLIKRTDSIIISPLDTLKKTKPKEVLEDVISHTADSLIRQDLKNKIVRLYDKAHVQYKDIDLQSGFIEINNNTSIIKAKGIKDSIGAYSQRPIFKQGSQESTQDSLMFNFKTEKAKIWGLKTEQQGVIIRGAVSKKHNDSIIFIEKIRLTTSEKENPDYYIAIKKAKFIQDSKLVASSSQLVIADVPTPLILPFAYIPLTKGRTSGFLMPTWGDNNQQGFFLQNGGYYFVLSDNFDLAVLGDIYTNGSWGLRTESGYAKRYKYSGKLDFRYESLINSLKGFNDYSEGSNYNIRWSHSQDTKASPNSRFSASVNLGSSTYYKQSINEYNTNSFLNNNLSSSVSFYKKFVGTPFNMSVSVTHSQNTNTEEITMTLPSLQLNMDRLYPFEGKNGQKNNALQKTGLTYSLQGDNRINTSDEFFFKKEMFDEAKSGLQHNLSLSTNMKALKYFTLSPNLNYKEVWYLDKLKKEFNDAENTVITDTINQFSSFREYSTGVSMSTTVYGMVNFRKGRLEAIRHVVRPSISYSYTPDFSGYYETYQKSSDPTNIDTYSPFANGIYGGPGKGIANNLNFSLNNNLEAKLRPKDSLEKESTKIILLNNLNFSSSYNMAADSLKWSPISANAGTKLFKDKIGINMNASLDPYALDASGKRINTFNIDNGGSLFRLTNAGITMDYSLSSKNNEKKPNENQNQNNSDGVFGENLSATNQQTEDGKKGDDSVKEAKLYESSMPWTLRIAYALNYSNSNRQNEISSNSLMFSGDLELTPKWQIGFSSGYDLKDHGFSYTQLRFSRDLDSWKLNFNWVPFGDRQTYYFFIGVKSSVLADLKYDKRLVPDKRLF